MRNDERQSIEREFEEFMTVSPATVPSAASAEIFSAVERDMRPPAVRVFAKTTLLQLIGGGVTLLFCPQFGFAFTSGMGLMSYLMKFGNAVCMLGCGALFTGFSLALASFLLRPEEVLALKRNWILQLSVLSTLSLGTFLCAGGEVVAILGVVWIVGSIVGGLVSLETGWRLRKTLMSGAVQ